MGAYEIGVVLGMTDETKSHNYPAYWVIHRPGAGYPLEQTPAGDSFFRVWRDLTSAAEHCQKLESIESVCLVPPELLVWVEMMRRHTRSVVDKFPDEPCIEMELLEKLESIWPEKKP